MNTTRKPIAMAALLGVIALALVRSPAAAAAGQMDERTKQGTGLVYDSLEAILKDLRTYDFAAGVGAPMALHAYVFAHKDNAQARRETEAALLEFVQASPAPAPGGLMAACRALSLVGGTESVPVLAVLALKADTTDAARYALERIPGGEADRALAAALDKAGSDMKRGIVFSLGARRAAAAVPALARMAGGKDAALAADAIKALGKIGGPEAVKALTAALGRSGPALKPEAASALLFAAETSMKTGDRSTAEGIYDRVFAAGVTSLLRQAAFRGKIAAGSDAKGTILRALDGNDASLYAPALAMVPAHFRGAEIGQVIVQERLPEENRIQLTALLAGYPAETVRPYLLSAAESPSLNVQLAALRSIATAGDGKYVIFLATKAARTVGAEQDAAREALARLQGKDADAAVLSQLAKTSDDAIKAELVRAAGERRIAAAKPALMDMLESAGPALKPRAAAALRTIAGTPDLPGLLAVLARLEDESAREALQDTIAAVARTNPRELARSGPVKTRLAGETDPGKRVDLLRILGKIGDDSALALVRTALSDPDPGVVDAAVRAMSEWPTVTARDDVFEIARASAALSHHVLATRAFVRMIGQEPYRNPEGVAADLLRVLAISTRPEEKRLVLGTLVRFPCVTGLKTAESLLSDSSVAREAKLAADRIRIALGAK